jgi:iron complex outermembrane receptor protein
MIKMTRRKAMLLRSAVPVFGFALLCGPQTAWAQLAGAADAGASQAEAEQAEAEQTETAQTEGVQDIIVTAQKKNRAERLQDVPVSVTALGSAQLEQTHFQNLTDIAIRAPGVSLGPNGGARGYASSNIRGLGTASGNPDSQPAVGVFVDGVYLGVNAGTNFDTFDLEGIEILRGPQGTLQGRNVTGGAVLLTTRRPGNKFSVYGQASIETGPEYNVAASVEGPIVEDRLIAKLSGYYRNDRGWFDNPSLGRKMGREENWFIRPTVVLKLGDAVTQTVIAERGRTRGDGSVFQNLPQGAVPRDPDFENLQGNPGYTRTDYFSITSETQIDVAFGDGVITNLFNYRELTNEFQSDYDGTPAYIFDNTDYLDQHQYSDELRYAGRFGNLDITAGLYYFKQKYFYLQDRQILNATINRTYGGDVRQESIGIFAQGEYHASDRLSFTLGGRYTSEKKDAIVYLQPTNNNSACSFVTKTCDVPGGPPPYYAKHKWPSFTPKFGINYKPEENVLIFASVSEGVRNGGYNVRSNAANASAPGVTPVVPANTVPASDPFFDVETVWSYEVGFKSDLFDRKVRLNGSVYLSDVSDLQRDITVASVTQGTVSVVANATDATILGFEAELTVIPVRGLELTGNLGYVDVQYKNVTFDLNGDGRIDSVDYGLVPPRTAPWNYNIGAAYTTSLPNDMRLEGSVNYSYRSRGPANDANTRFLTARKDLSANLTLHLPGDRAEFSVYGRNLLNTSNEGFVQDAFNYTLRALLEGRSIGVQAKFRF